MLPIRKKISKETAAFWTSVRSASKKVEQWPRWKRELKVTQYS